jgi:hypothetical protein
MSKLNRNLREKSNAQNTEAVETSPTINSSNETDNKSAYEYIGIPSTPITLVGSDEQGYYATIASVRMNKEPQSKEELTTAWTEVTYNKIFDLIIACITLNEQMHKEMGTDPIPPDKNISTQR